MFTPLRQGRRTVRKLGGKLAACATFALLGANASAWAAGPVTPVDPSLRTDDKDSEEISNVFRDMGVVQKRAMPKGGRFILASYGSFDFSDGPYTNYSLNVNPGYAISDFLEVYLNWAPTFFASQRGIVQAVADYSLAKTGTSINITSSIPKSQFGGEILWAPFYGKDSFGVRSIVRSDTFVKLGVATIASDLPNNLGSQSFMKVQLGLGKTFFLGRNFGLRVCASGAWRQDVQVATDGITLKQISRTMAIVESGLNLYL